MLLALEGVEDVREIFDFAVTTATVAVVDLGLLDETLDKFVVVFVGIDLNRIRDKVVGIDSVEAFLGADENDDLSLLVCCSLATWRWGWLGGDQSIDLREDVGRGCRIGYAIEDLSEFVDFDFRCSGHAAFYG